MPAIWCYKNNCSYCDSNFRCLADDVEINEGGECDTFEDYLTLTEYRDEYFIRVKVGDGKQHAKAIKRGKRLDVNGVAFYTNSSPRESEEKTFVTHGRTGYYCASLAWVKQHFDEFLKMQESISDVDTLPLAEPDDMGRGYHLVDEQDTGKGGLAFGI